MLKRGVFLGSSVAFTTFPALLRAQPLRARQFINDVRGSSQDLALTEMWRKVRDDTNGALDVTVYPGNAGIPGGDPQALGMVQRGTLQFFTLNGAILSNALQIYDLQTLPFVFRDRAEVFAVLDGPVGAYLVEKLLPTGIRAFVGGLFDNGMRQVTTTSVPLHTAADALGMRWRIPRSELLADFLRSVGAEPVMVNFNDLVPAIRDHKVEAQDNPLAFLDGQKLYKYQRYLNITNQAWAGFDFLANRRFFDALQPKIRASIERRLHEAVAAQRADQERRNVALLTELPKKGMTLVETDTSGFRTKLGGFWERRREEYGEKLWALLRASLGRPIGEV